MAPAYFDYNATTPLDPAIRTVLIEATDLYWANPSSIHQFGRRSRAVLDEARERVAVTLGSRPSEITFTSGGTEANNAAVFGAARLRRDQGRHLVCSAIEHPAVLSAHRRLAKEEGFQLSLVPVDSSGWIDPASVAAALRPDTVLVSVMAANNEIGRLQPCRDIAGICRSRGILFHCDAVQWFGKEVFRGLEGLDADLITLCGHKLHGPRGAGILYARSPLLLPPFHVGGAQEGDRRAGTENLPAWVALASALERFLRPPVFPREMLGTWVRRVEEVLKPLDGVEIVSRNTGGLANTLAFAVAGADSLALLANLDLAGFGASSGSACSSGSLEPSHVLLAMGLSPALASSLVRLSFGRENTDPEISALAAALPEVIARAKSC